MNGRAWEADEEDTLRRLAPTQHAAAIGRVLGRTVSSVKQRARKIGISLRKRGERQARDAAGLTPLDRHVLCLTALGLSNRQIARHLDVSDDSTRQYMAAVRRKLYLENRAQMVTYALCEGLVTVDDLPHPHTILEE